MFLLFPTSGVFTNLRSTPWGDDYTSFLREGLFPLIKYSFTLTGGGLYYGVTLDGVHEKK